MLPRAVRSVLMQTLRDFEVVVVDDGSTASYEDVKAAFDDSRIRYLRMPHNRGAAAARNAAIESARGEIIAFLDDDDELLPTFLEESCNTLRARSGRTAFSWSSVRNLQYMRGATEPYAVSERLFSSEYATEQDLLSELMSIGTGFGVAIPRHCLIDIGLFDVSLRCTEDTDLFIRLVAAGWRPTTIPTVQAVLHNHTDPRSTGAAMNHVRVQEIYRLIRKHRAFYDAYPRLLAQLSGHLESLLETLPVQQASTRLAGSP